MPPRTKVPITGPTRSGQAVPLHESEHTRISRVTFPGGSVIRKEPLGPGARTRVRRELTILKRLAGASGVAQLATLPAEPGTLLLEDVGGVPLTRSSTPLPASELVPIARGLARAVAAVHQRRVIHRDINPANILLADDGRPVLIDFALATTFAELHPEFTHHTEIVGTLPYLAPEATGRTGHPVDQRADLYALGATLYELATGTPPFGVGDPLRLTHDHLARVPAPPGTLNPALPAGLSDVIMHLLEKEPDNRYQTAEGLLHDLGRLDEPSPFQVGERDFPVRLRAPSRLVGRDEEIGTLRRAFTAALSGESRGVLVDGPPGVGKTALLNELRPIVTASNGWFVSGKFDRYRRDQDYDGVRQAFRALGRLLLAEPESRLTALRERIRRNVGANLNWLVGIVPEFAALLRVEPPEPPSDPLFNRARTQHTGVDLLRAVASRERPVVFVVDDLQWAQPTPLDLVDRVFSGEAIEGVLLVAAFRTDEVDLTHPLRAMVSRWLREGDGPVHLSLSNLDPPDLAAMVAEILRVTPERARRLAEMIAARTDGNPYDTLELLNALRRDGLLFPTEQGWRWEAETVRHRLSGQPDLRDLLISRAATLPSRTRALVEKMACLGGQVDLAALAVAAGQTVSAVEQDLVPALSEGLLVMEPGERDTVRFRHELIREAILRHLPLDRELAVRLRLARRLATRDELFAAAAAQYLPVVRTVDDPAERVKVVGLFRRSAEQARLLGNWTTVERLLTAALPLLDPRDTAAVAEVQTERHAALYSLGRLEEANEVYRLIEALTPDPLARVRATLTQVSSLTNQNRPQEAIDLGLCMLRQLGVVAPARQRLADEVDHGLAAVYEWLTRPEEEDLRRRNLTEPRLAAVASLINRILPPAYFWDSLTFGWLAVTAMRMWVDHGPGRTLVGPVSHIPYVLSAHRHDLRAGREVSRRVRRVSVANGWQAETSQAKFLYALGVGPWFEPIEEVVPEAHRARDELIQAGDQQNPCYTYYATVPQMLDYAPTLDQCGAEIDAALELATRTGNDQAVSGYRAYRRLVDILQGAPRAAPLRPDPKTTHTAAAQLLVTQALAAALFDDQAELERQSAALMRLLPSVEATYPTVTAHLTRGLALAHQVRVARPGRRDGVLADLDRIVDWFAARADDAPANLRHLQRLLEAERAWATGEFQAALTAFDAAAHEVAGRRRPWHRALILERAGKFYLAHGARFGGRVMLAKARQAYLDWGATAKANQLDWAYPDLPHRHPSPDELVERMPQRSRLATGTLDLIAILNASQALSSETGVEGLRAKVTEVLSAMTGATGVHLLLQDEDGQSWQLATGGPRGLVPVDDSGPQPPVPMSAVRYAERTREPFAVSDATRDDRFARDPYFSGLDRCALLTVPILSRAQLRALLLLENRLIRGAFSDDRLDTVKLIAGQLAVSLDNARLYTSLERMVAERTEALAVANRRLELLSVTDALTGLANRRRLEEVLDAHWRRARRARRPLALAMVDIDHFKRYNDFYGHAAGDRALQRIATLLKETIRDTDLAARFGGEEFAVVMPDTDLEAAHAVAERLHTAVVRLAERHELVDDHIVTVSIGVAALVPEPDTKLDQLVELADVELYRAKRGGRNQVRVAHP